MDNNFELGGVEYHRVNKGASAAMRAYEFFRNHTILSYLICVDVSWY